jgi:adenosyl cobinamide kinase/adenosyl cobinamide phosphate guanylyltransferase
MITLVLGGARSGKSELAERMAAALARPVTYVATAEIGNDSDFAARVEAHRNRRPADWRTVEAGAGLIGALEALGPEAGAVLVDSLGTWVAAAPDFRVDATGLRAALMARTGPTVVVSEEVGLGVHPSTDVGVRFRDALGVLNRTVADVADEVLLVVAGRTLRLDRPVNAERA